MRAQTHPAYLRAVVLRRRGRAFAHVGVRAWFSRMLGSIESRFPQRSILAIDALVILWTIAWVVLGVTVGLFVERLGAVGEGLQDAGRAIVRAGDSVNDLSDVPLVGGGFDALADEIRDLGRGTAERGRSVEDDVDGLAILVGASLALGPTIPVLVLWVPPRVSRERERRALTRSLRDGDGLAMAYLANRAVATRGFRELQRASADPVGDLTAGRYEALARLELEHLALRETPRLAGLFGVRSSSKAPSPRR
jgi:hypothetical protein